VSPRRHAAKRLIDTGAIGTPVLIRLRLGMGPAWSGWRDSPALTGGGLLIEADVQRLYVDAHRLRFDQWGGRTI
jgi:predicted dehydrogenase